MARPKETSDSLSHPVVEAPHIAVPPSRRTAGDYLALGVATCGVGFIPVAPGTWGSAVGVGVFAAVVWAFERALRWALSTDLLVLEQAVWAAFTAALLLVIVGVALAGTWAATRCESLLRKKDPGAVVVDEVAGQLITFLFVPRGVGPWTLVMGFLAFRLFDIWKPYPINRLEALPAGLGVMADDVLAGAYAATLMSLVTAGYLLLN
ncbi:MAG TPA: phosphatidylglycerophosphatase A [Pyrinomonadaceae bacterium]|nr:phosphatidylglycerophosphatase A [Pyrinomonadaceae bacterium]